MLPISLEEHEWKSISKCTATSSSLPFSFPILLKSFSYSAFDQVLAFLSLASSLVSLIPFSPSSLFCIKTNKCPEGKQRQNRARDGKELNGHWKNLFSCQEKKGLGTFLVSICLCQTALISISTGTVDNHDHLYSISYLTRNLYSQDLTGIGSHVWWRPNLHYFHYMLVEWLSEKMNETRVLAQFI